MYCTNLNSVITHQIRQCTIVHTPKHVSRPLHFTGNKTKPFQYFYIIKLTQCQVYSLICDIMIV